MKDKLLRFTEFLKFRINLSNKLIKSQIKNPLSIPVVIINYNQLFYLKKLVDFLLGRGFENIVIIDNQSSYPPLLEYYKEISGKATVELMPENAGHMVFFENDQLQKKYGQGFYFLTDADIVPNDNLPENFAKVMLGLLQKYFKIVNKVGFALDISDIPDAYPVKEKVLNWEQKYWKREVEPNVFRANVDTTFALYKPVFPRKYNFLEFISALRLAGSYTAKHGGWYRDPEHLSEEEIYFTKQVNVSSTWKLNEEGKHESATYLTY